MAPGRVESNETLDRIEDTMSRSTTRTVGPLSLTVCSPPSRRVAALRPRCAGLTALTPAARTVDRPLLPDRAGTGFPLQVAVDAEHPIFVAGRLHAPRDPRSRTPGPIGPRGGFDDAGTYRTTGRISASPDRRCRLASSPASSRYRAGMLISSRMARLRLRTAHTNKLRCPTATGGRRLELTRSEVTLARKEVTH